MKLGAESKKRILPAIMLSLALSFMLGLYAPLELYLMNIKDFWFDIYVLFPVTLVLFLSCFIIGSLILVVLALACKKWFSVIIALCFSVFLAFYIQGNYLVGDLPVLNGAVPKWENYEEAREVSLFVWLGIIILNYIILYKIKEEKYQKLVSVGCICITMMLLFTGVILLFSNDGLQHKQMVAVTTEGEFEMSTDSNFIILLVDTVDSRAVDVVLEKHPEYVDWFEDFTYYSNTVSGYNCTMESVPFILSGIWYENEREFDDYLAEVYSQSALFERLESMNYGMEMYSNCVGRVEDSSVYRFSNVKTASVGGIKNYPGFVDLLIKYVGFRYLPYQLKDECFARMTTVFSDYRRLPDEYELVEDYNNGIFYEKMKTDDVISLTDDKKFKFIHLEGAHMPFIYNEYVEVVDDATFESSVEASMTIVHTYIDHLKKAGIYDNSIVVVMADHGHDEEEESYGLRYNTFLMIKGLNEKKKFEISQAPISHEDMPEAFNRLLDGKNGADIFDWKEGDERERRFLFYPIAEEHHMTEYMIGTDSKATDAAQATGKEYNRKIY